MTEKICKCENQPLVTVNINTGKVTCVVCKGIRKKPKGRAKVWSDMGKNEKKFKEQSKRTKGK